jgi:tetratricopeptide (TPR) repeat protein
MKGGILVTRGAALLEMERYEEAAAELETALSYLGDDYLVLGNLAQAYIMLEDYEQAITVLDRAVMISSLDADQAGNAWYMKFAALTKLERDTEAAASLERALEFIPDNPDWWEYLASTYSRLGRRNDAIEAMEHAQQIRGTE